MRLLLVLFLVLLPAAAQTFTADRIVVVGDVHGDYEQFVTLLRAAKMIDGKNRWTGGKTHLVQTGDIPDRGPGTRKAMDLLMDLEKEAKKAGGAVHALIGNHEAMNMYGDLRYTTPAEFEAFKTRDSKDVRDRYYKLELEQNPQAAAAETADPQGYRKKWETEHPLGYWEHRVAFSPQGDYGKWIAGHNAVIKVNDTLFLHGGIGPKYLQSSTTEINSKIKLELTGASPVQNGVAMDPEGPLWYRGLADEKEGQATSHVEAVLKAYGVNRIVIGHTVTEGTVMPRFGGRVLMIDAGMSAVYGSRQAAVILEGGKAYALHRGARLEIPTGGGAELLKYLKQAAALDPPPSPLLKVISGLEAGLAVPSGR